jgi:mono/diheme cytochrome c family protein
MRLAYTARVAAGVLFLGATACRSSTERERVDFERMRVQQRYDLYGRSGIFPNHGSMQAPPLGTVTRESESDSGSAGTGMIGGQAVTSIPVHVTPQLLAVGQRKFSVYCAVCHGAAAFGGSLVAEDMGQPRAPSLRTAAALALAPGTIFSISSRGLGRMPAYAPQLSAEERWAVVAYLEQLQRTAATSPEAIADSLRAIEIRGIDSALAQGRKP